VQPHEVMARQTRGADAADELDAPILTNLRAPTNENRADLAGAPDVRAPARLQVNAFDLDRAKSAFAIHFLAHTALGKLFDRAIAQAHAAVFEDDPVGGKLCPIENVFGGLRTAQIDAAHLLAEMKRSRRQAKTLLKHGGEEMLAGVLLHVIEAARPVDVTFDAALAQRAID